MGNKTYASEHLKDFLSGLISGGFKKNNMRFQSWLYPKNGITCSIFIIFP
jgi:hypothetical protein